MSKRLRNRIVLIGGFLICLGIIVTAIVLIIVAICGGFSGNNSTSREIAEIAGVEVIYDTSNETVKPAVSQPADDTSSTENTTDTSSETSSETSSTENEATSSEQTSSQENSSADTSSTIVSNLIGSDNSKSPEDFVADFATNAA